MQPIANKIRLNYRQVRNIMRRDMIASNDGSHCAEAVRVYVRLFAYSDPPSLNLSAKCKRDDKAAFSVKRLYRGIANCAYQGYHGAYS